MARKTSVESVSAMAFSAELSSRFTNVTDYAPLKVDGVPVVVPQVSLNHSLFDSGVTVRNGARWQATV